MKYKIDVPFGAHDSELKGWEYTIPEGMVAIIKDGKVIVREKESEDEIIRKSLIGIVEQFMADERKEKTLAWLEKQKEPKWSPSEGEMGVLYKLCYISNQITDEDDTKLTRLYQDLKREYFNGHSFENMFSNEKQKEQPTNEEMIRTLRVEYEKGVADTIAKYEQKEQKPVAHENDFVSKPAEWSEEDEDFINMLILHFNYLIDKGGDSVETYKSYIEKLKSLRPQPKQEWSEEDIKKIRSEEYTKGFNDAAFGDKLKEWSVEDEDRIRQIERIAQQAGCTQKLQEEIHDWLKSLRPSWKPSEEQMEAFKSYIKYFQEKAEAAVGGWNNFDVMIQLFEQLKKLI